MAKNISKNVLNIIFVIIIVFGIYKQDSCYAMWIDELDTTLLQRRLAQQHFTCSDPSHGLGKSEHCPICASLYRTKNTPSINVFRKRSNIKLVNERETDRK